MSGDFILARASRCNPQRLGFRVQPLKADGGLRKRGPLEPGKQRSLRAGPGRSEAEQLRGCRLRAAVLRRAGPPHALVGSRELSGEPCASCECCELLAFQSVLFSIWESGSDNKGRNPTCSWMRKPPACLISPCCFLLIRGSLQLLMLHLR